MLYEVDDGVLSVRQGDFMTQTMHYTQYVSFAKDADKLLHPIRDCGECAGCYMKSTTAYFLYVEETS